MEIERKFLVRQLPEISHLKPIRYERYYIKNDGGKVERIQKKGEKFEYETKTKISNLESTKGKREITKEEFEKLKEGKENEGIIRDGYQISEKPNISIKIYHGRFDGLMRAEVEFSSKKDAEAYIPEKWMGTEITLTPLGEDSRLLNLSREDFLSILNRLNN